MRSLAFPLNRIYHEGDMLTNDRILRRGAAKTAALAMALVVALAACGGGSGDDEAVPTSSEGAVEETVATEASDPGTVEEVPVEDDLASIPLLEPALEIEVGPTDEPKAIALSPDGGLVAVLGGGLFSDVDAFLKVYDTTTGDLAHDLTLDEESGSIGRLYWTSDNHLI